MTTRCLLYWWMNYTLISMKTLDICAHFQVHTHTHMFQYTRQTNTHRHTQIPIDTYIHGYPPTHIYSNFNRKPDTHVSSIPHTHTHTHLLFTRHTNTHTHTHMSSVYLTHKRTRSHRKPTKSATYPPPPPPPPHTHTSNSGFWNRLWVYGLVVPVNELIIKEVED